MGLVRGSTLVQGSTGEAGDPSASLLRWQERLLPFTTRFMVGLALVFLAFTIYELIEARNLIFANETAGIRTVVESQLAKGSPGAVTPEQGFQHSLLLLEADVLDRRYHQASALLMSRIWMKHLAFMTGMAMSFLGALFILGKITETTASINMEVSQLKTAVSSASPGIILSFLGTILLIVSLLVQTAITVQDAPVYVRGMAQVAPARSTEAPAKPLDVLDLGPLETTEPEPDNHRAVAPKK